MKIRPLRCLLLLILLSCGSLSAYAQTSASHTVRIGIQPITVIAVSGNPLPMMIDRDTQTAIRDITTHYNLTTNVDDVWIEASLDFPMPNGLELRLSAETGLGQSRGFMVLTPRASGGRLVEGISRGLENGRLLAYELVVKDEQKNIPLQDRRVTLAIVNPETGYRQEVVQTITFSLGDPFDTSDITNE